MANVYYSGEEFSTEGVLVEESMIETILRLDEVYWGLRKTDRTESKKALRWLESMCDFDRRRVPRKTPLDREMLRGPKSKKTGAQMKDVEAKLLTSEAFVYGHHVMLNFLSKDSSVAPGFAQRLSDYFLYVQPGPKGQRSTILESGMYCCQPHTIPYQHTLFLSSPDLYREQEKKYMAHLKEWREHSGGRRWYRAPFYYTILTLHDINTPATRDELHQVAKNVNPNMAKKWQGDDRADRARNLAANILMQYQ